MSSTNKEVFFQVATFTFIHPLTGDKIVRNFVGQAIFTPKEIEAFEDFKLEEVFQDIEIDQPYNPYEDDDNVEAHRNLTESVRKAMDGDIG